MYDFNQGGSNIYSTQKPPPTASKINIISWNASHPNDLVGSNSSNPPVGINDTFGNGSGSPNSPLVPKPDVSLGGAPLTQLAKPDNTQQEDELRSAYMNALNPNYGFSFNNNAPSNKFTANANIQKGR